MTRPVSAITPFSLSLVLVLLGAGCSGANLGSEVTEAVRDAVQETAVDDLLESEPAVTTSFSDAVTGVSFLDGYQPTTWRPLSVLPRADDNMFRLAPGRFEFVAQSYCLHAGTHASSGGKGYLWAPLRGPRADIIRSILRRSVDHPEIPQRDVQSLIWAVLARVEFSQMPPERQAVAAALLTAEELFEVNGGALGLVPDRALARATRDLPEPLRAAVRARAEIRRLYADAEATYEELEEAAVLAGAAPEEHEIEHVPRSRWSFHPDGYFVRYRPHGYKRLRVQLYVPHRFELRRNGSGAITTIANAEGDRIDLAYAGAGGASSTAGSAAPGAERSRLRPHRIRRVRFVRTATMGPEFAFTMEDGWTDAGWTLVGDVGAGEVVGDGDFPGLEARIREATALERQTAELEREVGGSGPVTRADVIDLGHLVLALRASLGSRDLSGWRADHLLMLQEAWAWAVCRHAGACSAPPGGDRVTADRSTGAAGEPLVAAHAAVPATSGPSVGTPAAAVGRQRPERDGASFSSVSLAGALQDAPGGAGGPSGCAMPANTSAQRLCPSGRNGGRPGDGGGRPGGGSAPPGAGDPPWPGGDAGDGGPGEPGGGDPGGPDAGGDGGPGGGDPGDPGDPSDDVPPDDIPRPEPGDDEEEPDEQTCEAVQREIDDLRTVRDAFADQGLLEQAQRNDLPGVSSEDYSYQDLVKDRIRDDFAEEGRSASPAMSTDASCRVDAPPRSEYTEAGTPGVVWDAARWHEQVHRENCQADSDWYDEISADPEALREEELEAYDEAIDVLEEYRDANCG